VSFSDDKYVIFPVFKKQKVINKTKCKINMFKNKVKVKKSLFLSQISRFSENQKSLIFKVNSEFPSLGQHEFFDLVRVPLNSVHFDLNWDIEAGAFSRLYLKHSLVQQNYLLYFVKALGLHFQLQLVKIDFVLEYHLALVLVA
jgi:hypothetical protein